jgi:ABC-type spermidine/putrescine transport system permease subunit II
VEPALIEGLFFTAAAATVVGVLAAYLIQQRVSEALASAISDDQALEILIRRSIFSVAAVELPAMLGLVGLLLSGDASFAAFALPFFVVLALLFPTADRVRARVRSARGWA